MQTTFQDDLLGVGASRLRASGAITADAKSVVVAFGQGDDALWRLELFRLSCLPPTARARPVCRQSARS
jgi:hypothetical protein